MMSGALPLRSMLNALALAAIVAMCIQPSLLRLPFADRLPSEREMGELPDRQWPQYPRFLEGVRAHTLPGDTIAVVVPEMGWGDGYSYAYYRASYYLTGREVLPLVDSQDRRYPTNFRAARYVAAYGVTLREPAKVVWRGEGGSLVRIDSGMQR